MSNSDFPQDSYTRTLLEDIFPIGWKNPLAASLYDLLIIGGGPGGMTAATIASQQGLKVALVEKEHMGGECLIAGCIPSKALIRSSRVANAFAHGRQFGIEMEGKWQVNFAKVMERVRRLRQTLSPHDSVEHFRSLGVDIFLGQGRFTSLNTLEVAHQTLLFKKAIIATGTVPIIPPLAGLRTTPFLTNQTIFNLTSLPSRLAVIGAGPIGCEMAQAFARLGSQVTLITRGQKILPKDDPETSMRLQRVLENEGVKILLNCQLQQVEKKEETKILYYPGNSKGLVIDQILIAIGRQPVVEGLGLEKAGVIYDFHKGIQTDEFLQTANPNIFALWSPHYNFTHFSQEIATIALQNAFENTKKSISKLIIPRCTYTSPEIAHVGLEEKEAIAQEIQVKSIMIEMKEIDRAILDEETGGFFKILVNEADHQILGATLMAAHAGEMISSITVAMTGKVDLFTFAQAIHPFPTQIQVIRKAAQALNLKLSAKAIHA